MTKRTFTKVLIKYKLEYDVEPLYKYGVREIGDVYWVMYQDLITILKLKGTFRDYKRTRYRLKATWADYCNMYKQETGKDIKYH